MVIELRRLPERELHRLDEIDATEDGDLVYVMEDGAIAERPEDWHRPRWSAQVVSDHRDAALEVLAAGGIVFGVFDGDLLVAIGSLRPELEPGLAQLVDLQVSRSHRRMGIGTRLVTEVRRAAREAGATRLYVSACPSRSAVGLYRRLGFQVAARIHPELFALEPEDIHMTLEL